MLLSYEIDTKDETLTSAAIELRRRIARRKLKAGIDSHEVDEDALLAMKEANRDELKEQGSEVLAVTMAGAKQKVAMNRIEQQMSIQKTLG